MEKLKSIEISEIARIKVNGIKDQNIFDAANECIYLANLLKVLVELHWNGKVISIYRSSTVKDVIEHLTNLNP